jgi:hypothetical protein
MTLFAFPQRDHSSGRSGVAASRGLPDTITLVNSVMLPTLYRLAPHGKVRFSVIPFFFENSC